MLNEVDIDFRIPGLPHSVVKQTDNYRVRELVKKIESHPHRQSTKQSPQPIQCDVQENDSGHGQRRAVSIVRDRPEDAVQRMPIILERRHRPLHMRASLERKCCQPRRHQLYIGPSLNSRVRDKEKTTSYHRYGKTPQQKEYHQAHNLRKRCIKRHSEGIHDRFSIDPEFRASQLEHDRTEEVCIEMDELADKNFSHYMTQ